MRLPDAIEAEIRIIEEDYGKRGGQQAGPARLRGLRGVVAAELLTLRERIRVLEAQHTQEQK